MRVIAGTARGKNLQALPGEDVTRPTINRVKEAMFSSVQFLVPGARVLDLFAGSGQLGIEALSRGAKSCIFVDRSSDALAIVKANCKTAGVDRQSDIRQAEALPFLANIRGPFDLVLPAVPLRYLKRGTARPGRQSSHRRRGTGRERARSRPARTRRDAGAGQTILLRQDHGEPLRKRGTGMNVEELLDLMEETLEAGTAVPFAPAKRVVDVDRMRDIIDEVRNNLPDEIRESKKIVNDREQIMKNAQVESETIIQKAEERAGALVSEQEIVKRSRQRAAEILTAANTQAKDLTRNATVYCETLLKKSEETLARSVADIKNTRMNLRSATRPNRGGQGGQNQ